MTDLQKLELKLGEIRRKLAEAIGTAEPDMTVVDALTAEIRATDALLVAQRLIEPEPETTTSTTSQTAEERELAELRSRVEFGKYVGAALGGMPVIAGPEAEYNQLTWACPGTTSRWNS